MGNELMVYVTTQPTQPTADDGAGCRTVYGFYLDDSLVGIGAE